MNEIEDIKYTIILNRPLPRVEASHKRWFIDGRELNVELVHRLLRLAGHKVEFKDVPSSRMPIRYKGVQITCCNGGLMVYPKDKVNFAWLKKLLLDDGYFFHSCYLPNKVIKEVKSENDK